METLKQEQEDEMKRLDEKRENLELELHHQREEFAVKVRAVTGEGSVGLDGLG